MGLLKNILYFWPEFIREASLLFKFRTIVKGIKKELEEQQLRIDWKRRI